MRVHTNPLLRQKPLKIPLIFQINFEISKEEELQQKYQQIVATYLTKEVSHS